jgi:hypothetical protein
MARLVTVMTIVVALMSAHVGATSAVWGAEPERDGVIVLSTNARWPGKIFVNHDEVTFFDEFYREGAAQFARNLGAWFAKDGTGRFLVYSSNRGLTGTLLERTMVDAGHEWTVTTDVDFSLSTLLQYDAVFLLGDPADTSVLIDYVHAGGNVYVGGGTGWGGPAEEAARWNPFLNAFGLQMAPSYNNVFAGKYMPIQSASPLFHNVPSLYQWDGNSLTLVNALGGDTTMLVAIQQHGLYATYASPVVPVALDIVPSSCSNPLDKRNEGTLKVAVVSTATFDARKVDPASVRLFGVGAYGSSITDAASPTLPLLGRTQPSCSNRLDGRADLLLSFDGDKVVAAMKQALGRDLDHDEVIALVATGRLKSTYGSAPVVGEDLVTIVDPGLIEDLVGTVGNLLGF